jgi:hypothetical protein
MEANYPDVCKNMEDILHSLGFENIVYNENGDLIGLTYSSKSGQEELFFEAMSPFIVKDSYINWRGEDGELWQWYFDGEKMHTRYATISYQ